MPNNEILLYAEVTRDKYIHTVFLNLQTRRLNLHKNLIMRKFPHF